MLSSASKPESPALHAWVYCFYLGASSGNSQGNWRTKPIGVVSTGLSGFFFFFFIQVVCAIFSGECPLLSQMSSAIGVVLQNEKGARERNVCQMIINMDPVSDRL